MPDPLALLAGVVLATCFIVSVSAVYCTVYLNRIQKRLRDPQLSITLTLTPAEGGDPIVLTTTTP